MLRHKHLLPSPVSDLLYQVGQNIDLARKRRRLTIAAVCERAGITPQTYRRLAAGESGIGIGVVAAVLHALNLEDQLTLIASPASDEAGIAMERARQATRVRGGPTVELDTDF
ncbi:helix-turn-helix domain-containing protein [Stutzerimonas stutzeri]|uniref:helix-turn-helix domain-containing protein n=1 Tax=Stutzerimonas stutzeri TaxID=316 RepID=UPI00265D18DC|nr:helix-turn-helix transcriptional regulator [Stutzerimonas stutzeri]MCF6783377.1 helix-turn-helix domain-containing protein [Stutzerimonas stutzeri]